MVTFETYIFNEFFTDYDHVSDPNKDADGKGTQQRFTEVYGAELDELLELVKLLPEGLIVPYTLKKPYVAYAESELGYIRSWEWLLTTDLSFRRNVIAIMQKVYEIRGTKWAHDLMFSWIGLSVVINEGYNSKGFDSPDTFDNPNDTFDSFATTCSDYTVDITGTDLTLTSDQIKAITTILLFNQPINADLAGITYNTVDVSGDFTFDPTIFNFHF